MQSPGGYLPSEALLPVSDPRTEDSPLTAALRLREAWTQGIDLPPEAPTAAMCQLIDKGYQHQDDQTVVWENQWGRLTMVKIEDKWQVETLNAPTETVHWNCHVQMGIRR